MSSLPLYFNICVWVFFYISSIKLNYFLREPGLDEKGPIIQFESTKKSKTLQHARFLEEETFNTHSS